MSLGRRVAVKVLPRPFLSNSRSAQRFAREAQTAAKLHHTNIVPVFGVGQDAGYHYYVMQLIEGVGLDALLARLQKPGREATGPHIGPETHTSASGRSVDGLEGSYRRSSRKVSKRKRQPGPTHRHRTSPFAPSQTTGGALPGLGSR